MIEISPEELLPENFADFKKQIPDLKIADRLSAENPLKPLLTAIENHRHRHFLLMWKECRMLCWRQWHWGCLLLQQIVHREALEW